jgi:beta-fructofuranosidase
MYTLLQHPERFVWDFWYHYDNKTGVFHVLYLNADPSLVPSNQHHFSSFVGYAMTEDFTQMEWIEYDVFHAQSDGWDNTSIWSGDLIHCKDGYLFYYTSRDSRVDDGMTQNIGLAFSTDFRNWTRVDCFRLEPEARYYEPRSVKGDDTIHAWRDPFLFCHDNNIYMLIAAKSIRHRPTRKGTVGILKSIDNSLTNWEALPPLYASGWVSECDVPLLYQHNEHLVLVYTCWAKFDHAPSTKGGGGLHMIKGKGMDLTSENFSSTPTILLTEETGFYACRVIPELGGDLVGPDFKSGGICRVAMHTGFQHLNRDFSSFNLERL